MPVWVPHQYDSMVSHCFNLHIRTLWFSSWTTSSGAHMTPSGLDDETCYSLPRDWLKTETSNRLSFNFPVWVFKLEWKSRPGTANSANLHWYDLFWHDISCWYHVHAKEYRASRSMSLSLWVTPVSCEQLLTNLVPLWSDGCFGWCTWVKFSGKQLLLIWDIHVRKTRIRCKLTK